MARAVCATKVCRLVAHGTLLRGAQKKMINRRDSFFLQAAAKGGARGGKAAICALHCNNIVSLYKLLYNDFEFCYSTFLHIPKVLNVGEYI